MTQWRQPASSEARRDKMRPATQDGLVHQVSARQSLVILLALLLTACGQAGAATPTATQTSIPEPTLTPSPTDVPTLAHLPDGSLVYGDPEGRFSVPLVKGWMPVETDGSYGHFRLSEPEVEMYVVTVRSEDLDAVAEEALERIGLDPSTLTQLAVEPMSRWTAYTYTSDSGEAIGLLVQRLDGASIAIIGRGELSVLATPIPEIYSVPGGLAPMPLADYLQFQPPPVPSTITQIEDLDRIEFYSGRTRLVGRLVLPEGEGPFPAVVYVHGSALSTRTDTHDIVPALRAAGVAVFSYDKRGVGESEGIYLGVTGIDDHPGPSEWTLPTLADDALAAVRFLHSLQEIDPQQIGLLGQSQAGSIIPQVAARSDIPSFAVTVIGQTVSVGEVYFYQALTEGVRRLPPMTESERDALSAQLATFDGYPGFDPRPYIEAMSIPALWIWGDRDGWVPPRKSKLEMERIIAEHNKDFTIIYDPDYGHDWPSSWTDEAADWILDHLEQ